MVSSWKAERDSLRDDLYPYITVSGVEMEAEPLGKGPIQWQDNIDYSWEDPNWPDPSDDGGGSLDVTANEEIDRDEFVLLPEPGPGPQTQSQRTCTTQPRVLDDEDDTRVIIEHSSAGTVLSKVQDKDGDVRMGETSASQSVDNQHTSFSSELDWKVAEWAIKESIGHNAMDRLLAIPGVRNFYCFNRLCRTFHSSLFRLLINLIYPIITYGPSIKRSTPCLTGLENGKPRNFLSMIVQKTSTQYDIVILSRPLKAFSKIPIMLNILFMHRRRYMLMRQRKTASSTKCGLDNGGMFFR